MRPSVYGRAAGASWAYRFRRASSAAAQSSARAGWTRNYSTCSAAASRLLGGRAGAVETRYAQRGKTVEITGLNAPSADLHAKLAGERAGSN
ncbi:hypothetical protein ACH4PU_04440 [Streptomyces sp. NPDC021100]|uniref:hypothetical protein n=1 Tax=Streptomyces sp. NPDC021100 TaxID=3365114 RepID=UPI0037A145EC